MMATDGTVPKSESPAGVVWTYNVAGFPICAKVSALNISMIEENGGRAATVLLDASGNGLPTYPVPQGLPHTEENLSCDTTIFVANFNHEDPGTVSHGTALSRFPATVLATVFGITHAEAEARIASIDPKTLGGLQIDAECQARCAAARG
eukprot:gene10335-8271_t